ncbi:MAG: trypsin-like peptidase domain-containing protein [Chroococcus sp. CMT-3BRIN-NPC107]|jgi:S1-C subfamily serine protease|nr:trypsin-like peptidase domain-containing protein [Chroococcus sp. CMT-3BRIN-NPC107]
MRLKNKLRSVRQLITHGLAIAFGVVFAFSSLQVLPSQALSIPTEVDSPQIVAQQPPNANVGSKSFVAAAVNKVGSAVVRIDTERTVTRRINDPMFDDPVFRRFFGEIPQRMPEERLRGIGSGFIIDRSGEILTNAHVVNQADKVTVRLKDGRTLEGTVQGADEVTDLAVIKVNSTNGDLPVAPLGDSSEVQVGDWAIAVGNPLGFDSTVTLGIVSTLKRSSAQVGIPDKRLEFIQTDAAINPGNSGGPLLNDRGEVIGINTAIRADAMGIGFAIPINKAKDIKDRLMRGERIAHPYLGVQMENLTPELAKANNTDPNSPINVPEVDGVLVVRVVPNSPAATAGLRRGDVILQIDKQPVTTGEQLQNIVENSRIGQTLQLKIQRGNQTQQIGVKAGELQSES